MDATMTRASTVIRSIPTSETRTHASMTMPLSRTRSRTSMRLDPPDARSTAMRCSLGPGSEVARGLVAFGCRGAAGQRLDPALEQPHLLTEAFVLHLGLAHSRRQVVVVLPPVEPDLLRLVDGADDQPDANGEELDFGERNLDVARDHEAFVEDAIEHIHETA